MGIVRQGSLSCIQIKRKKDRSLAENIWRDSWLLCFETTLVTLVQLFQNEEKETHVCGLTRFHLSWMLRPHSFQTVCFLNKQQIQTYKKKPKTWLFPLGIRHLLCLQNFPIVFPLYFWPGVGLGLVALRAVCLCPVPWSTRKLSAASTPPTSDGVPSSPSQQEGSQRLIISTTWVNLQINWCVGGKASAIVKSFSWGSKAWNKIKCYYSKLIVPRWRS